MLAAQRPKRRLLRKMYRREDHLRTVGRVHQEEYRPAAFDHFPAISDDLGKSAT